VPGIAVSINVDDSAGQAWRSAGSALPDATGGFTYQFQLPGYFVANYTVTATQLGATATTTFTDNIADNLDQCQNINLAHLSVPCGTLDLTGGSGWQNGDVNGNNSQYREGDGLPYRGSFTGLGDGTFTITLDYDFSKGGVP